jgi:hypothetical protein
MIDQNCLIRSSRKRKGNLGRNRWKYKTLKYIQKGTLERNTKFNIVFLCITFTIVHIIFMHISYALHSIYCNLADLEYILVPEQGVAQEVVQDLAPEPAIEDVPALALEGKPRFYA